MPSRTNIGYRFGKMSYNLGVIGVLRKEWNCGGIKKDWCPQDENIEGGYSSR